MSALFSVPMGAAYHVVLTLTQFLSPLPGGLAATAAIVAFTIGVRLLLSPLSYYAFRGQAGLAAFGTKAAELRSRFGAQPERLERELAALYRQEGSGLLAGCLPMVAQLPFFSVMYRLFLSKTVAGHPNTLLASRLLAAPLGSHWLTAGLLSPHGLLFLGLFALLALACYLATRLASTGASQPNVLTRLLPYTTVVIAAFVPLAAGIYLLTTTSWTALERAILQLPNGCQGMKAAKQA